MANRILIADDSVTMQKAFTMTFAAEDVTVMSARSSDEGLSMARQARPDLVIADVAMPGRSGYELCQLLKADPALRDVPVIMLGSVHTPVDEVRLRQCGADGQTQKPFDSTTMINLVREAIAKAATTSSPAVAAQTHSHSAAAIPGVDLPDDYGEIAIEDSGETLSAVQAGVASRRGSAAEDVLTPPPEARPIPTATRPPAPAPVVRPVAGPSPSPSPSRSTAVPSRSPSDARPPSSASGALPSGMRPSLIPGLRPGALPSHGPLPGSTGLARGARPAAGTQATAALTGNRPGPALPRAPAPPVPSATPASARTLVGLPAVAAQPPPRPLGMPVRAPASAATPATPVTPDAEPRAAPVSAVSAANVASKVDQKIAAIAARGPEYEAIAKLSREIIERVVWEVVPELAAVIVREELAKRGRI